MTFAVLIATVGNAQLLNLEAVRLKNLTNKRMKIFPKQQNLSSSDMS
ncbi:hypothetical protein NG791_10925 [Laspinema sp. D1]|nr:hypothetical protein [Laspinema sp. D2b]